MPGPGYYCSSLPSQVFEPFLDTHPRPLPIHRPYAMDKEAVIQQIIATVPVIAGEYAKLLSQVATLAQTLSSLQAKQTLSSLSTPSSPPSTTTVMEWH